MDSTKAASLNESSAQTPCRIKTSPAWHPALAFAATLAFAACAPLVSHQVPFREADFAATQGHGAGSVIGQVSLPMSNGFSSLIGVDEKPVLMPVTAYTDEIIQKQYVEGRNLATGDPRYDRYLRTVQADSMGHFAFHGVPPGNYYLVSGVESSHWIWNTDQDGNLYKITIVNRTPLFARISVHNGQIVKVANWTKGKSKEL